MAAIKMDKQAPDSVFQSCSVCLEPVTDGGDRSIAKLKCGHHFHLDCIGSAFNAKGSMQCPNCRHVEDGQWLYANGCRRQDEFAFEDMFYDEGFDIYTAVPELILPHEEMHFGHVQWCPYRSSYPHFSLSVEEVSRSPTGYADLVVNVLVGEHTSNSYPTHPCPFIQAQGATSVRHLVSPEGNVAARDMASGSQHGAPVMAAGAALRQIPAPQGGSWFHPNATRMPGAAGSVENGQMGTVHPHDRSRWGRPDLDRFSGTAPFNLSRPSEAASGAIEMRGAFPYRRNYLVPGQAGTIQPPSHFGRYPATNVHSRRSRGRASSQMPHSHVAYPHGGLVLHGGTNWGTPVAAAGQETVMGAIELGQMDRTSMAQWQRDDSPVIPLFPLEPESQRWMQPLQPQQPSSTAYQSDNMYSVDLSMQGGMRMSEGSLANQYQGNSPVFTPFPSDSQPDMGSLHSSHHPSR